MSHSKAKIHYPLLAEALTNARTKLGISRLHAAELCGVSVYKYQLWERGHSPKSPRPGEALKVLKAEYQKRLKDDEC